MAKLQSTCNPAALQLYNFTTLPLCHFATLLMIYHMLPRAIWEQQSSDVPYAGDTLATEGFIHCTAEPEKLLQVANSFYRKQEGDWLILCIDEAQLQPEVRWEINHGHLFPHIYGALNLDAVVQWIDFPRTADGSFVLPRAFIAKNEI